MFASMNKFTSIVVLSAALMTGSSHAAILTIVDQTSGQPEVTTFDLISPLITFANGTTNIQGQMFIGIGVIGATPGQRSVALVQPTGQASAPVTDVLTLTAGVPFVLPFTSSVVQLISVDYTSARFGPLVAPAGAVLLPLTGQFQGLTAALDSGSLFIGVQSVAQVPEPSTLWLLGFGLAGLAACRLVSRTRTSRRASGSTLERCPGY